MRVCTFFFFLVVSCHLAPKTGPAHEKQARPQGTFACGTEAVVPHLCHVMATHTLRFSTPHPQLQPAPTHTALQIKIKIAVFHQVFHSGHSFIEGITYGMYNVFHFVYFPCSGAQLF